jgi:hypothetical protein
MCMVYICLQCTDILYDRILHPLWITMFSCQENYTKSKLNLVVLQTKVWDWIFHSKHYPLSKRFPTSFQRYELKLHHKPSRTLFFITSIYTLIELAPSVFTSELSHLTLTIAIKSSTARNSKVWKVYWEKQWISGKLYKYVLFNIFIVTNFNLVSNLTLTTL